MTSTDDDASVYEVRTLWYEGDGSVIVHHQQVVPRRWWNHVTRPVGLLLVVVAVGWPVLLFAHGWTRVGLFFAVGDGCVVFVGLEMIQAGARRWKP